jgi:hypothetical protein
MPPQPAAPPVVATNDPPADSHELLALGADLDIKVAAYRAAAARKAQANAAGS